AVSLRHTSLLAAPGTDWVGVVPAFEGDAPRAAAAGRHPVDLRPAAAVGREVEAAAVRAPDRRGVDAELVGDLGQGLAAEVHHVDLGVARLGPGEGQAAAI